MVKNSVGWAALGAPGDPDSTGIRSSRDARFYEANSSTDQTGRAQRWLSAGPAFDIVAHHSAMVVWASSNRELRMEIMAGLVLAIQQTRDVHPMLVLCWPSIFDVGPTLPSIGWTSRICWLPCHGWRGFYFTQFVKPVKNTVGLQKTFVNVPSTLTFTGYTWLIYAKLIPVNLKFKFGVVGIGVRIVGGVWHLSVGTITWQVFHVSNFMYQICIKFVLLVASNRSWRSLMMAKKGRFITIFWHFSSLILPCGRNNF